jgi:hypothetical protein
MFDHRHHSLLDGRTDPSCSIYLRACRFKLTHYRVFG